MRTPKTTDSTDALTVRMVAEHLEITYDAVRQHLKRLRAFDGAIGTDFRKAPPTQAELQAVIEGTAPVYTQGPINCGLITYDTHAECSLFSGVPWAHYRGFLSRGIHPQQFIWPDADFDPSLPVTVDGVQHASLFDYAALMQVPAFMLFWAASKGLLSDATVRERKQISQVFDLLESVDNYKFPSRPLPPNLKGKFAFGDLQFKRLDELCEACDVALLSVVKLVTREGLSIQEAIGFLRAEASPDEQALTDLMACLPSYHTQGAKRENPDDSDGDSDDGDDGLR